MKYTLHIVFIMFTLFSKHSPGQITIQIHNKTGYNVYNLNYQGYYLGDLNKDKVSPLYLLDSINIVPSEIKGNIKEFDLYELEFHNWCGTGRKTYKDTTFVLDLILNEGQINKPTISLRYHKD